MRRAIKRPMWKEVPWTPDSLRAAYAPSSVGKARSCTCNVCVTACHRKPGWFLPDQIAPLAKSMGLSIQALFNQHLSADFYVGDGRDILVLSPRIDSEPGGRRFPEFPRGRCALLVDDRCSIHDLKPWECAAMDCETVPPKRLHFKMGQAWDTPEHQKMVQDLLAGTYMEPA